MYFFIDPANLTVQEETEAYGPILLVDNPDGTQSSVDPSLKYNITSKFQLTNETKAFVCVDGQLIVQQSDVDSSLVNLIIKPCFKLNVPIEVEYYIYRGILKSSLIDDQNNSILPQGSGTNDLINRIWQDPPSNTSYSTLGYDGGTISGGINIEDIFNFLITGVDSIYVMEGEWFGTFSNVHKIGFEVILKTNKFSVNLDYVRSYGYEINTTGINGLNERVKREEILNFIDPVALYGIHFNERVKYYDPGASNNTQTTTTNSGSNRFIYTKLIEKFFSKNKVYIDIRSEKGYSYNFYQNYKISEIDSDNIQIRVEGGNGVNDNFVLQTYSSNNWPILILESDHSSGDQNRLRLKLRINDNISPILYTDTKLKKEVFVLTTNNIFNIKEEEASSYLKNDYLIGNIANGASQTEWTNEFSLFFHNTQTGSNRYYISNYAKLHYYRTVYNSELPSTVLKNEHYYDSSFCSIDIPTLGDNNAFEKKIESSNPIYVREPNNDDGTGNFQLNMINGAYWDSSRVLFYSTIQYENTAFTSEKEFLNAYPQKLNLDSSNYNISELKKRTEIICREYEISSLNTIRIPGINFYKSKDLVESGKNYKENALLLGFTIDELNSIKIDTQLNNLHQRFIYLNPDATNPYSTIPDVNNDNAIYRYYKYTVQLQGLDSTGNREIITPLHNGSSITVYSRDNQFFSSKEFSANEALTTGQNGQNEINRIEFHIYHDGVVKINDNVDLALMHDMQNFWFFYHGPENVITELTDLDILMINKMGQGYTVNSIPTGYTSTIDYTPYNSQGVDAKTSYLYPSGTVITNGFKYNNSNYKIRYDRLNKKSFLLKLEELNIASVNLQFEFAETRRFYCKPDVAAAFFGALIDIGNYIDAVPTIDFVIKSTGGGFEDGTAFPSVKHNNGEAIDTKYQTGVAGLTQSQRLARDQAFVNAMQKFGSNEIFRGRDSYSIQLINASDGGTLHNTHLHSGEIVLKNGNKVL